jgi:putative ABC transport system ATP-binding protein
MVLIDRILRPLRQAHTPAHPDEGAGSSGDSFRIQIQRVSKTFLHRGELITALDDVSLDVLEGEFLAIVGRSGSGKTSLMNILAGWDHATAGQVRVFGRDPRIVSGRKAADWHTRTIGYVPQKRTWMRNFSVLQTLELPLLVAVPTRARRLDRIMDVLGLLRISSVARLFPEELTIHEQMKVAVAYAMVADPKLLLLDQVGSGSSSEATMEVLELLQQLNQCQAITVIISGGDERIAKFAVRTKVLAGGRLQSH